MKKSWTERAIGDCSQTVLARTTKAFVLAYPRRAYEGSLAAARKFDYATRPVMPIRKETTMSTDHPEPLRRFIGGLAALLDAGAAEDTIVERGGALLAELLAEDEWLADEYAQPDPQFYRQYLLYRDPAARFSVVSFVWGPGQSTPVHDHTVWGLIGMLRGAEIEQGFTRDGDARLLARGAPRRLDAGMVAAVSPALGDIHQVSNAYADRVSVGIHVYGADIGAVDRFIYLPDGEVKPFRSGYANLQTPAP
jgi:predicted metal-dependent enzyme (double-stranded beta helix superfamily)